jgi:hypothetical protein
LKIDHRGDQPGGEARESILKKVQNPGLFVLNADWLRREKDQVFIVSYPYPQDLVVQNFNLLCLHSLVPVTQGPWVEVLSPWPSVA